MTELAYETHRVAELEIYVCMCMNGTHGLHEMKLDVVSAAIATHGMCIRNMQCLCLSRPQNKTDRQKLLSRLQCIVL